MAEGKVEILFESLATVRQIHLRQKKKENSCWETCFTYATAVPPKSHEGLHSLGICTRQRNHSVPPSC